MASEKLNSAIAAIKAGDKTIGLRLLSDVVKAEPSNEIAWLWLSTCVENIEQKKYCLKRALSINPDNQNALKALAQLERPPQPSVEDIAPSLAKPTELVESEISSRLAASQSTASTNPTLAPSHTQSIPSRPTLDTSTKRKQVSSEWIIFGILSTLLVLGIAIIGVIGASILLRSTPTSVVSIGLTTTPSENQLPVVTPTIMRESSPTKALPTNTPKPAPSCQSLAQDYLDRTRSLLIEFGDAVTIAESTPRIALGSIIQDMQRIKRDIAAIPVPTCVQKANGLIANGMDGVINAFIDFMGDKSDTVVQRELNQGLLDLTNGTAQLIALASGQATPAPKKLPTDTPVPTLLPSPTPLPAGSAIVLSDGQRNSWQIKVTKVLIEDTLKPTFSDTIEKAAGRFAIVFMEVTNRGLSPGTFVAFGNLDIQDSSGQRFEENFVASFYAQDIYGTDICADINPDFTKYCVAVYDISPQSSFYILVPGKLVDPYAPRLLLDVP